MVKQTKKSTVFKVVLVSATVFVVGVVYAVASGIAQLSGFAYMPGQQNVDLRVSSPSFVSVQRTSYGERFFDPGNGSNLTSSANNLVSVGFFVYFLGIGDSRVVQFNVDNVGAHNALVNNVEINYGSIPTDPITGQPVIQINMPVDQTGNALLGQMFAGGTSKTFTMEAKWPYHMRVVDNGGTKSFSIAIHYINV